MLEFFIVPRPGLQVLLVSFLKSEFKKEVDGTFSTTAHFNELTPVLWGHKT